MAAESHALSSPRQISVAAGERSSVADLVLQPNVWIIAHTVDAQGKPVSSVVSVVDQDRDIPVLDPSAESGNEGVAQLQVQPGTYRIEAEAAIGNARAEPRTIIVNGPNTVELTFKFSDGILR